MYFIYLHENRTMKTTETVVRRGRQENVGGGKPTQGTLQAHLEMLQLI
jgi:hypothetical protein